MLVLQYIIFLQLKIYESQRRKTPPLNSEKKYHNCFLSGTSAVVPNLLQGVTGAWQKERARDKVSVQWGFGMTCCSQGTKGHEAARTLLFTDHFHTEQNGEGIMAGCAREVARQGRLVKEGDVFL